MGQKGGWYAVAWSLPFDSILSCMIVLVLSSYSMPKIKFIFWIRPPQKEFYDLCCPCRPLWYSWSAVPGYVKAWSSSACLSSYCTVYVDVCDPCYKGDHSNVHGLCYLLKPCWCPGAMLLLVAELTWLAWAPPEAMDVVAFQFYFDK